MPRSMRRRWSTIWGPNRRNIIANPNCSTAQLVVVLKPLHDLARIRRWWSRPISRCRGRQGRDGRAVEPDKGIFVTDPPEPKKFTKQIAFNVIPHVDVFMDLGDTREEWKMTAETKKILDPKIKLTATCVRVPVFVGHSEAVNIEFERPISAEEARDFARGPRLPGRRQARGWRPCDAGRMRRRLRDLCFADLRGHHHRERHQSVDHPDNLRKGAALNTVQIAETIINRRPAKKAA